MAPARRRLPEKVSARSGVGQPGAAEVDSGAGEAKQLLAGAWLRAPFRCTGTA